MPHHLSKSGLSCGRSLQVLPILGDYEGGLSDGGMSLLASSELPIRLKITRPATIAADTYHDFMTRMIAIKIAKKSPTP